MTLVGVQEGFRVGKVPVKRRLYTVRVAFDASDPAIASGNAMAATAVPPSDSTLAAIKVGKAQALPAERPVQVVSQPATVWGDIASHASYSYLMSPEATTSSSSSHDTMRDAADITSSSAICTHSSPAAELVQNHQKKLAEALSAQK